MNFVDWYTVYFKDVFKTWFFFISTRGFLFYTIHTHAHIQHSTLVWLCYLTNVITYFSLFNVFFFFLINYNITAQQFYEINYFTRFFNTLLLKWLSWWELWCKISYSTIFVLVLHVCCSTYGSHRQKLGYRIGRMKIE